MVQPPVSAHVIDKGLPTTRLLVQVLVAKYLDHLPMYRQEGIFGRAGVSTPRSTLAQRVVQCGAQLQPLVDALCELMLDRPFLQADATPVAMLVPGKGKTHWAYTWTYGNTAYDPLQAVVYDLAEGRASENARRFLTGWQGKLVCDDFKGYKAPFASGVTEIGCLAHARRKFFDLWANHQSPVAEEALRFYTAIYDIEQIAQSLDVDQRIRLRALKTQPIMGRCSGRKLRTAAPSRRRSTTARIAGMRSSGSPRTATCRTTTTTSRTVSGRSRSAAVMSLIQLAKLNGLDPYAYLNPVLERLPTQPASRIEELLWHRWAPA